MRVGLSLGAKRRGMTAPDLRTQPPPRWNAEVDGVIWLPRFAAKTRAYAAGTLGMYLHGQSPVDDAFLRACRLTYRQFDAIVLSAPDDRAVLAAIEAASPGSIERLRLWGARFAQSQKPLIAVLDIDDGYASEGWRTPLRRALTPVGNLLVTTMRRLRPLPK
jgi:hypothetical protein